MMIVLSPEEALAERERQRTAYAEALEDTLRAYPGTDPAALAAFGARIGGGAGLLDAEDIRQAVLQAARA